MIWVMKGTKLYTTYNHLSYWAFVSARRIRAGQVIGRIGTTGERHRSASPLRGLAGLPVGSRQQRPTPSTRAATWRAAEP